MNIIVRDNRNSLPVYNTEQVREALLKINTTPMPFMATLSEVMDFVDEQEDENSPAFKLQMEDNKRKCLDTVDIFIKACHSGDEEFLKSCSEKYDVELVSNDILRKGAEAACHSGQSAILSMLLAQGLQLTRSNYKKLLNLASSCGHLETIKILLENDNCPFTQCHAFRIACRFGQTSVVKHFLLQDDFPHGKNGPVRKGFLEACRLGHEGVARVLLSKNMNPQDFASLKETRGFNYACEQGQEGVAKLLLANGVNPNKADKFGNTGFYEACTRGYTSIVELILEHEVDVLLRNKSGDSGFHIAASEDHVGIVRLLIEASVGLELTNEMNGTPFHSACIGGARRTAKELICAGCNPLQMNKDGKTGFDFRPEFVSILRELEEERLVVRSIFITFQWELNLVDFEFLPFLFPEIALQ